MELRPYQETAVRSVEDGWKKGTKSLLLVAATGTGKTCISAQIISDAVKEGKRVLFLAHRDELLSQAQRQIKSCVGLDSALEKAKYKAHDTKESVVVASVQTLARGNRIANYPKDFFDTIIVDEAHHAMAEGYQRILNYFDNAKVLGITATPDRGDQRNISTIFTEKAFEYSLPDAIKDGYLCPITTEVVQTKIDISQVHTQAGELKSGEVADTIEPHLEGIAKEIAARCQDRHTLVFLPLVSIAKKFADMLNEHGMRAAEIDGESKERAGILADFEADKYNVLCNAMLLTEGFDCPKIDCVVCLRPTKIRSLFAQEVGRGTRLYPGKKDLLLLDFLWLTGRHELSGAASLVCEDSEVAKMMQKQLASGEKMDILEAEQRAIESIFKIQEENAAIAKKLAAQRLMKKRNVDPLQYAYSIQNLELANYKPVFAKDAVPPTREQISAITLYGVEGCDVSCSGMADMMLDVLQKRREAGLSTPRQIRWLENNGFLHVGTWKMSEASELLDVISGNKWVVPSYIDPAAYTPKDEEQRHLALHRGQSAQKQEPQKPAPIPKVLLNTSCAAASAFQHALDDYAGENASAAPNASENVLKPRKKAPLTKEEKKLKKAKQEERKRKEKDRHAEKLLEMYKDKVEIFSSPNAKGEERFYIRTLANGEVFDGNGTGYKSGLSAIRDWDVRQRKNAFHVQQS